MDTTLSVPKCLFVIAFNGMNRNYANRVLYILSLMVILKFVCHFYYSLHFKCSVSLQMCTLYFDVHILFDIRYVYLPVCVSVFCFVLFICICLYLSC